MGQLRRRRFLLASGALLAAPSSLLAQQSGRIYRIGFPWALPLKSGAEFYAAFEKRLRELGYTPGKNIVIDRRSAEGKSERVPEIVRQIVRAKPDVIVAGRNVTIRAAKAATKTIPIVMVWGIDVVRSGLVASLARPGGNVTGLTFNVGPESYSKRIEQLKEILPSLARVGYLVSPVMFDRDMEADLKRVGSALGVEIIHLDLTDDFERSFATAAQNRVDALLIITSVEHFNRGAELVGLAAKYRLPASYSARQLVGAGGLMSYGANVLDLLRRAVGYVDKILKGAKPADLPVERPTKLELFINLKTAKALGLTIPQSLLLEADRVIE